MRIGSISLVIAMIGWAGCSAGPPTADLPSTPSATLPPGTSVTPPDGVEQPIPAATGGVVAYGDEAVLTVPPGSLPVDTTLGVAPVGALPAGDADGLSPLGRGYRFTPAGTQFSLANPALLAVRYDPAALAAKGFDASTIQLYYFDEAQARYVNVPSTVDPSTTTVSARVEHFTIYTAFASALLPGSHPPFIAMQNPVPPAPRAGAPLLIRATIKNTDPLGAVAGARLYYRATSVGGTFASLPMARDLSPNVVDTFAATLPAGFTATIPVGAGPGIDYYVQTTSNLGVPASAGTATAPLQLSVAHSYAAGSLTLTPTPLTITAGFTRVFTAQAKDEAAATYAVVPDSIAVGNGVGTVVSNVAAGVTFTATHIGGGTLTAAFSTGANASAAITVIAGALSSITILGPNGMAPSGTLVLKEGQHYAFDAIGRDDYGNTIYVLPQWGAAGNLGPIDATGTLYTIDAGHGTTPYTPTFGQLTATVGEISAVQWLQVSPRAWVELGDVTLSGIHELHPSLTLVGATPYLSFSAAYDSIHVRHFDGTQWIADADPVPSAAYAYWSEITSCNGTPYVFYVADAGDGVMQARVKHLAGDLWVDDGGPLNVAGGAGNGSIACDGGTPYVAWEETGAGIDVVYVKRFDGTSWVGVGGTVGDVGASSIEPSIAVHGGVPMVAFTMGPLMPTVHVRQWSGTAWSEVAAPTSLVLLNPAQWGNSMPKLRWGATAPWLLYDDDITTHVMRLVPSGFYQVYASSATDIGLAIDGDTAYFSNITTGPNPSASGNVYVHHCSIEYACGGDDTTPINAPWAGASGQPAGAPSMVMGPSTPYLAYGQLNPGTAVWEVHVAVLK